MDLDPIEREHERQIIRKQKKKRKSLEDKKKKILSKIKKLPKKTTKIECDRIWTEIIKKKAGYKSELSGNKDCVLAAHHIVAKPNLRLRYEIKNGICLDNGKEHIFGIHNKYNPAKVQEIHNKIINHIGQETYNWLLSLRHDKTKQDLDLIKIYLQNELKKL